ncbi:MAG: six-cysteine ranthipeptide SCIFF [Oscillospiraceae bacterium]|nr:six-cysteine ranthipeptide SCIFF [Oscillospiraceae bacterium]
MEHIKTVNNANLKESCAKGGCGECQASCQSACKTFFPADFCRSKPSAKGSCGKGSYNRRRNYKRRNICRGKHCRHHGNY